MHITNLYITNQPGAVESRGRREPGPNLIDLDSGVGALAPGGRPGPMSRMKCLATFRLLMTLPTRIPILSGSFSLPASTAFLDRGQGSLGICQEFGAGAGAVGCQHWVVAADGGGG